MDRVMKKGEENERKCRMKKGRKEKKQDERKGRQKGKDG